MSIFNDKSKLSGGAGGANLIFDSPTAGVELVSTAALSATSAVNFDLATVWKKLRVSWSCQTPAKLAVAFNCDNDLTANLSISNARMTDVFVQNNEVVFIDIPDGAYRISVGSDTAIAAGAHNLILTKQE